MAGTQTPGPVRPSQIMGALATNPSVALLPNVEASNLRSCLQDELTGDQCGVAHGHEQTELREIIAGCGLGDCAEDVLILASQRLYALV